MQRRTKRRLALLLLIVVGILAAGAGLYQYRRSSHRREQAQWKAQGLAAAQAGDNQRAVELLARYLKVHSDDAQVLGTYASVRLASAPPGDPQAAIDAIWAMRNLSALKPLDHDQCARLLELVSKMGDDGEVIRVSNQILATHPDEMQALRAKTLAQMREHDWSQALDTARYWNQAAPLNIEAHMTTLAAMQQQNAAAADIVGLAVRLRASHRGDPRFELLESIALTLCNQTTEQNEDVPPGKPIDPRTSTQWAQTAARHAPFDAGFTRALVDQFNRLGLFDDSMNALQKAVANGADASTRRELARRLWEASQWSALSTLCANVPPTDRVSDPELLFYDGVAQAHMGRHDELAAIRNLLTAHDGPAANGWLMMLDQLTANAEAAPRHQVESLQKAMERDAQNPLIHYFLAQALLKLGEVELATGQLRVATQLDVAWAAPPAGMADLMLQQSRIDAAMIAAGEAQRRVARNGQIADMPIAIILARVRMAALKTGRLKQDPTLPDILAAVQRVRPGEVQTLEIQVALRLRENDSAGAKQILASVIRGPGPLSEATLLRYAAISRDAGLGLESECLDRCEKEHGITADLAYTRAAHLLGTRAKDKAMELFNAAYTAHYDAAAPDVKLNWDLKRALILEAAGDASAVSAWTSIGNSHPDNLLCQQLVLGSRAAQSDRDLIDHTIERLHTITGDMAIQWRIAKAQWLLKDPKATPASSEAVAASLRGIILVCPDCVEARLILASCLANAQQNDAAIDQLKVAIELRPDSLDIAMQLVQLLEKAKNFGLAESYLAKFTDGPLANAAALSALGWLQEQDGTLDSAERSYRQALRLRPDLALIKNNLAMVLLKEGGADRIHEAVQLASEAAKSNPAAMTFDTLAFAQGRSKDFDAALASIAKAIALNKSDVALQVRQAELLADAKQLDAARTALAELRTKFPTLSANLPDAATLSERIATLDKRLNPRG